MSINFDLWDRVDYFKLYQAACLWVEIEPPGTVARFRVVSLNEPNIQASYQSLVSAYKNDDLSLDHTENILNKVGWSYESFVTRDNLVSLANKRYEKPLFLFHELRGETETVLDSVEVKQLPNASQRGRKPIYDWPKLEALLAWSLYVCEEPRSQEDLIERVERISAIAFGEGSVPSRASIQNNIVKRWWALKSEAESICDEMDLGEKR